MISDNNTMLRYMKNVGKRGERTVYLHEKSIPFIKAFNSDIGRELLADLISMHEALLEKVAGLNATDEEKMMYKVAREMLLRWSGKIAAYEKRVDEITKAEKGE